MGDLDGQISAEISLHTDDARYLKATAQPSLLQAGMSQVYACAGHEQESGFNHHGRSASRTGMQIVRPATAAEQTKKSDITAHDKAYVKPRPNKCEKREVLQQMIRSGLQKRISGVHRGARPDLPTGAQSMGVSHLSPHASTRLLLGNVKRELQEITQKDMIHKNISEPRSRFRFCIGCHIQETH